VHTARKLDVLTLLALALVLSVLALDRFYPSIKSAVSLVSAEQSTDILGDPTNMSAPEILLKYAKAWEMRAPWPNLR
jgi:hypothetical protein